MSTSISIRNNKDDQTFFKVQVIFRICISISMYVYLYIYIHLYLYLVSKIEWILKKLPYFTTQSIFISTSIPNTVH